MNKIAVYKMRRCSNLERIQNPNSHCHMSNSSFRFHIRNLNEIATLSKKSPLLYKIIKWVAHPPQAGGHRVFSPHFIEEQLIGILGVKNERFSSGSR